MVLEEAMRTSPLHQSPVVPVGQCASSSAGQSGSFQPEVRQHVYGQHPHRSLAAQQVVRSAPRGPSAVQLVASPSTGLLQTSRTPVCSDASYHCQVPHLSASSSAEPRAFSAGPASVASGARSPGTTVVVPVPSAGGHSSVVVMPQQVSETYRSASPPVAQILRHENAQMAESLRLQRLEGENRALRRELEMEALVQEVHRVQMEQRTSKLWDRLRELENEANIAFAESVEAQIAAVESVEEPQRRARSRPPPQEPRPRACAQEPLREATPARGVGGEGRSSAARVPSISFGAPAATEFSLALANVGRLLASVDDGRACANGSQQHKECELGPDHIEVAATLTELGKTCADLGDSERQKELVSRALLIRERISSSASCESSSTASDCEEPHTVTEPAAEPIVRR